MNQDIPAVIEIKTICRKILKESVLDVFYLIMEEKDISKSEIQDRFIEYTGAKKDTTRFRYPVNEGIAKLEGAMFIDSYTDGTFSRYYLTPFGEAARDILASIVREDPLILKGSKITSKIMLGEA